MSMLAADQRLLVIVPAFNEEASLANVIVELRAALPGVRVVVINDGSHDATQQVAEGAGTQVVNLPYNLGIGASSLMVVAGRLLTRAPRGRALAGRGVALPAHYLSSTRTRQCR